MPVQINEVVIRTVVDHTPAAAGAVNDPAPAPPPVANVDDNELAEKILAIIREKKER
ncbi:DUF5908 family protein [Taibaiella soli]|uniref:DUF5908 family protein n=1 Tax=Taibaiella soli TaxID=1649169 RepID=UPI0014036C37|nr:DUF5908 family protein [Taibaiella soli]